MRLTTITGLSLCLFLALTSTGCKRMVKEEPLDMACNKSIHGATTLLEENRERLEKNQLSQLENLITAAKIDQQHQKFAECHDKTSRALLLLRSSKPNK